ncbi:MAG TPA: hypothetical protein VJ142_02730 [Candidatus Nanoarchaeia archaeon]|nr:hypothetical protein [Candidatus Nanoarchaeia archaeon]
MENRRGIITSIVLSIFLMFLAIPLVSAEIIINTQPNSVYNLGDIVPVSVTLKSSSAVSGFFKMDLVCGGNSSNFYTNSVKLAANEQRNFETSLILEKIIIGELKGTCTIKAFLGADSATTIGFKISDVIVVESNVSKTDFNPEESIFVSGNAFKENGNPANGFVELSILGGNSTLLTQQGTVNNGLFSANITLPEEIRSGNYLLRVMVYEQDLSGGTTNTGFRDYNIYINQVPTSLEIVFETNEIEPGTSVNVKAVLYDQTGVKIDSTTFLTIKNNKSKILEQIEIPTEEFLEFPIAYNEAPLSWKVVAVSHKLTSESGFRILEKEAATIEIINKTVLITNTGNVPYNKTVLVKIGDQPLNIDVYLKVDESQRWLLTAPDGEYAVEVNADGQITGASVALTGSSVDVKKASATIGSLVRFPAVWIFILAILGFVAFIFFKRGYQKAFIGYISSAIPKKSQNEAGESYVQSPKSSKAELALSIRGDKQDVSMITLKAKNMASIKNMRGGEGSAGEILKKAVDIAESHKAATYEDNDNLFFIFAPARTKTFKNEEAALRVSQRIKEILDEHNRLFKQKIDFGISLNYGTIIGKQEPDSFKFMGMGNLMMQSKKIASIAGNEILMGERITDKLRNVVKTEKHRKDNMDVYAIKEIKKYEEHQKFLRKFMERNK